MIETGSVGHAQSLAGDTLPSQRISELRQNARYTYTIMTPVERQIAARAFSVAEGLATRL